MEGSCPTKWATQAPLLELILGILLPFSKVEKGAKESNHQQWNGDALGAWEPVGVEGSQNA